MQPTQNRTNKVRTAAEIVQRLETHRTQLEQLRVKKLYLFGSIARNEATDDSDIDFLLEYTRPFGLFQLAAVDRYLEEILGRPVDLGTKVGLKPGLHESVSQDLIDVF